MRAYTVTIIRMAITVAAAIHMPLYLRTYPPGFRHGYTCRASRTHTRASAPRARKSTRIPGNRLRCAAPAGIEFIIPLGTAPLPDHFRVFAFHGTDRHVPPIEPSFSISLYLRPRCVQRNSKNSRHPPPFSPETDKSYVPVITIHSETQRIIKKRK